MRDVDFELNLGNLVVNVVNVVNVVDQDLQPPP